MRNNSAPWEGKLSGMLRKQAKVGSSDNQLAIDIRFAPRWWTDLAQREGMAR